MSRFLTGITKDLEEECRAAVLHDNMDLTRLMVHVQQMEDNQKKRGPRLKKEQQSLGNSNFQRSTTPRGGRHDPKKRNGGDMQRRRMNNATCSRAHSGEYKKGTNSYFGRGRGGHMGKDCPQNRGKAGGNAQPRPNPQGAAASEPPKRNMFYSLKGREEQEKSTDVVTGSMPSFVTRLLALTFEILPEVLHDHVVVVHL
ncbi:uncharacterized protein LOC107001571 [Solanum pennellii]|uniref:Uncharacterized protein LOC107001571 n=1 Tax=Solanum pennellii TaxID=28526 RepID=A0ABM1FCR9_SOLPN|nr:uncharacterized protein LOC107001571 [Solanum pennellii]